MNHRIHQAALLTLAWVTGACSGAPASRPATLPARSPWRVEYEQSLEADPTSTSITIDSSKGCTAWYDRQLTAPVTISYTATVIVAGGKNDRLSDLNCFWMASDARAPADFFGRARSGAFADYDQLRCYYVGYGGNANTTTRFRRYIGEKSNRPLLPEHDLSDAGHLLLANHPYHIRLTAAEGLVTYSRDGETVFAYRDEHPYAAGYFGLRTTHAHISLMDLKIEGGGEPTRSPGGHR